MKILIVDDDVLVRVALKSMINWDEGEFQLVGEAENGEAALKIIGKTNVDLVITDMKMPVMDGIQLIRQLKKLPVTPGILVLSNYDDYCLVREALKLGAEDYLLKINIEADSLNCLLKNYAGFHKNHEDEEYLSPQKSMMKQEMFLKGVLQGIFEEKYIEETMRKEKIRLYDTCPGCLILKIHELFLFEDVPYEQLYKWSQSFISFSVELLGNLFHAYCLEMRTGEFVILISGKNTPLPQITERDFRDTLDNLREMLWQYLNVTITIGAGIGEGTGSFGIQTAVQRAKEALQRHYFETDSAIIVNQAQERWKDQREIFPAVSIVGKKKEFHDCLLYRQKEEMDKFFQELCEFMESKKLSMNDAVNLLIEIYSFTYEFFEIYQIEPPEWQHKVSYRELTFLSNKEQAVNMVKQLSSDLTAYIEHVDDSYYYRVLQQVKIFMERHYAEDISLQETAVLVNMNPSYLSSILKKYMGKSYIEYLIDLRIKEAKRLLSEDNQLKVYEIGEKVGYDNMYYFNRIFKKVTGVTPGDYRKQFRNLGKVQQER